MVPPFEGLSQRKTFLSLLVDDIKQQICWLTLALGFLKVLGWTWVESCTVILTYVTISCLWCLAPSWIPPSRGWPWQKSTISLSRHCCSSPLSSLVPLSLMSSFTLSLHLHVAYLPYSSPQSHSYTLFSQPLHSSSCVWPNHLRVLFFTHSFHHSRLTPFAHVRTCYHCSHQPTCHSTCLPQITLFYSTYF